MRLSPRRQRCSTRPGGSWRRALALVLVLVLALGALSTPAGAQEGTGSDVFGNVTPATPIQGDDRLINRWPMSHYQLDVNVDQGALGVSNIGPAIFSELSASIWEFTSWLTKLTIDLFTWAFSLDLINGDRGPTTAGPPSPGENAGALDPVADAVDNLYTDVLGRSWLVAAVIAAGMWGIWKALVQRRYTESAGALAISVVFAVLALWIINAPQATVGAASEFSNDMSLAFLGGVTQGDVANPSQARDDVADTLFERHIYEPWVVLNFGGLRHCVNQKSEIADGYFRPVAPNDPDATVCRSHTERGADGHGGYASRFLAHPPRSEERTKEFDALRDGETPDDAEDSFGAAGGGGAYEVDKTDSPAVDVQMAGGAYQRLALAGLVFLLNLGAVALLGFLALAIMLAQVLALVLLAFAPVALLAGIFPGRGHEFFKTWGAKLLTAIAIKAIYSLLLAVVLAVGLALSATADAGEMGFLFAFGLQALFFWAIFIYRKQLVARLTQATTARTGERQESSPLRYLAAGGAVRLATQPMRSMRRAGAGPSRQLDQSRRLAQEETGQGPSRRMVGAVVDTPQRAGEKVKAAREGAQRAAERVAPGSTPGNANGYRNAATSRNGKTGTHATTTPGAPSPTAPHHPAGGPEQSARPPAPGPNGTQPAPGGQGPREPARDVTPKEKLEQDVQRLRDSSPREPRPKPRPDRQPPPRTPRRGWRGRGGRS